jgi:hypothetical protein
MPAENRSGRKIFFDGTLLFIAAFLTLPELVWIIGGGLENSWQVGLHRTTLEGLIYGKDFILTYGPLGYLRFPLLISRELWLQSVSYILLIQASLFLSLFLFIKKESLNWTNSLFLIISIFISVLLIKSLQGLVASQILIILFIFDYLYLYAKKRNLLGGLFLGILHSHVLYVKFTDGLVALLLLTLCLFTLFYERRRKEAAIILAGYCSATFALGLLTFSKIEDIISFFYVYYKVVSGYIDSESKNGPLWQVYIALIDWAIFIGFITYAVVKKNSEHLKFFFLASGILFASFKIGFVRHDNHVLNFFFVWTIVFTLYYSIASSQSDSFLRKAALFFSLFLLFVFVFIRFSNSSQITICSPLIKLRDIRMGLHLLADKNYINSRTVIERKMHNYYSLQPKTIQMLWGHTVDFFPWDIAIAEQYGLNWIPRPACQSYMVFNDYFDSLNEQHFSTSNSPEYLLYSIKSIDNKYPFFDEPATFRVLLQDYRPVSIDGEFIILQKVARYMKPRERSIGKVSAKMGEKIDIPKNIDGYLFARIYVDYTVWWNLIKLLYKPPHVFVQLIVNGNSTAPYTFIPSSARNGVFVSQFIETPEQLFDVWHGKITKNLDAMIITVRHSSFFQGNIRVEFFEIAKN